MSCQHQQLASGKWHSMTFVEQMANIGSEVERAIRWKEKANKEYSQMAFERALELLDLTISDSKNLKRLKELARTREILVDYFKFSNDYHSTDKSWSDYFYPFNYASRQCSSALYFGKYFIDFIYNSFLVFYSWDEN